jgi:tetratricopeptide (TPR) repeat protein
LPAAILLVLWWKYGRLSLQRVMPLVPMFAIGLAAGVNTILMEKHHVGAQGIEWHWSWLERVLIAGRVLWFYACKVAWPQPLVFIYPKWQIDSTAWWQYLFVISFLVVVVSLWWARKRLGRGPLVAVLFFAGTLFPALGFIDVYPMRYSFVADHFQYLASIGVISLIAAAGATVASRLRWNPLWSSLCVALVLLVFVRVSFVRCFDYLNAETLWRATLAENPDCWMAKYNLGSLRFQQQRYDEAYKLMQDSLRPRENDEPSREERADMYFYMGATLLALGSPDEAQGYYQQALEDYQLLAQSEDPPNAATYNNLGIVHGVLQQPEEAVRAFQRGLEIDPNQPKVRLNLGEMYYRLGQFKESEACFRQVLSAEPQNVRAHYNLGTVAWSLGRQQEAIEQMRKALRINPSYEAARIFLQQALANQGPERE